VIDVRRMELLRELSIRGTVSATARAMHLSGPAVSQQLAVLEREAGVPLLEKRGRTLAFTEAGRLLVTHADVVLADLASAEAQLAALRGGTLGTVRVAAFPSVARAVVARLWVRGAAAATLDLRLLEREPEQAVEALLGRDADVAVVHAYSLLPRNLPDCDRASLLDDPVLLALHPAKAEALGLHAGAPVRLAELADARWLVPGAGTSCHEMIRRACGAAGFVPQVIAEATDFSVLAAMAAAGAGVALMPRMTVPDRLPGLSLHPLAQPVTRSISVLARSGESVHPAVRRTIDDLHAAAAAYAADG
jgi:DNA-binding transcriptional LysR family regulator